MPSRACSCKVVDGNEIAASRPRNSLISSPNLQGPRGERKGTSERSARRNPERTIIVNSESPNCRKVIFLSLKHTGASQKKYRLCPCRGELHYKVSSNFRPTASVIIRKVESCMSVSPFSRSATYSLFLPILSASCC